MRVLLIEGTWNGSRHPRRPRFYLNYYKSAILKTTGINQKLFEILGPQKIAIEEVCLASQIEHDFAGIFDTKDVKDKKGKPLSSPKYAVAKRSNDGIYVYNDDLHKQGFCAVRIGCHSYQIKPYPATFSVVIRPDISDKGRPYRLVVSLHPMRKDSGRIVVLTSSGIVPQEKDGLIRLTTCVELQTEKRPEYLSVSVVMFVD